MIAKVNVVFVFHAKIFKEAMLTHLFNYIYNDCKQLLSFSWSKKINTENNNGLARKQGALHKLSDFSRVFRKKFDITGQKICRHHTDHTRISWVSSVTQANDSRIPSI